jgi:hypothetical protein
MQTIPEKKNISRGQYLILALALLGRRNALQVRKNAGRPNETIKSCKENPKDRHPNSTTLGTAIPAIFTCAIFDIFTLPLGPYAPDE